MVHGVLVEPRGGDGLGASLRAGDGHGSMRRHEGVLGVHPLGAGALHAHHAPVVDNLELAPVEEELDRGGRRGPVFAGHQRHADVVGADVDARGGDPGAGDQVSALHGRGLAGRAEGGGAAEFTVRAIGLDLGLLGIGRQQQRMPGGQGQHPGGLGAAAGDLHHHPVEGRHVELVAAEAARLDDAVEARLHQLVVDVLGHAALCLAAPLALPQRRPDRAGARQHRLGREAGLGRRDAAGDGAMYRGRGQPRLPGRGTVALVILVYAAILLRLACRDERFWRPCSAARRRREAP